MKEQLLQAMNNNYDLDILYELLASESLLVGGKWYDIINVDKEKGYAGIAIYDDDFRFNDVVGDYIELGFDWYKILYKGSCFKEVEIPFSKIKKTDICPF